MDLSSDGRWVLARQPDSNRNLVLTPAGTGAPVPIEEPGLESVSGAAFFPDGKRLLLQGREPGQKGRLYVQDLPSGKPKAITNRGYGFGQHPISPDGAWIVAYGEWSEDFFLLPAAGGEPRTIPHTKDLSIVRWTPDGKFFYALVDGSLPARVVRVEAATGRREAWKELAPPDLSGLIEIGQVCVTPDGEAYAYGYGRAATSDLYVVEGLK